MTTASNEDEVQKPDDAEVVRALVENHRAFLGFLERRVGRRDVAEDILQEAFARGLEKASEVRDREAVVPWFYRLLRNAVIDHHRRHGASERALTAYAGELEVQDEHVPPPDDAARGEVCRCVTRLGRTLKPEYEAALQRIEVDGIPVKAFAAEQGISESNAAVRVFRARQALRKQLVRSCGSCATHGCLSCTCGGG